MPILIERTEAAQAAAQGGHGVLVAARLSILPFLFIWRRKGGAKEPAAKLPSDCHSERSEESRSEYFQGSARSLVACGSSE